MLKRSLLPAACAIGAALSLAAGCKPPPPPANPSPPPGVGAKPAPPPSVQDVIDTAPIADAVAQTIKKHPTLFPKGVTLQTITVHAGVAALDFSPQFTKLAELGDTTEARAQKQLRAALAQFPAVEKMTVTVQGKPYDSQTADWTTPFPVRQSQEEKEAAASPDSDSAPASEKDARP